MFKNLLVYRIAHWNQPEVAELEARLQATPFTECGPTQIESHGWVPPRGQRHGALLESIGGHWILRMESESKSVPAAAVKRRLEHELDKIESETGRRPKGKRAKEIKEQVVHELLPRAFAKRCSSLVWVDPKAHFVFVEASSFAKADRLISVLIEALGEGASLQLLQSAIAPSTAMAEWLRTKDAPAGFSVDRECELKQPDSEKAAVRYSRHTLDTDEVAQHIAQGKLPTQLAMTWEGRVSFVLTDAGALKKIALLDVVFDSAAADSGEDAFDADVAISTGELGKLMPDLLLALGGSHEAAGTHGRQPAEAAEA